MSKEAMTLALEALTATMSTHGFREYIEETKDKAIKALEEALAKQEQGKPVGWPCLIAEADFSKNTVTLAMQCTDYKVSADKHWLCTTPQPKQEQGEPVAWMHLKAYGYAPGGYMMTCRGCNNQVIDVDKRASRCRTCAEAAYIKDTTPQLAQKPWVGLTDEDDIDWEEGGNLKDLVKAIEAKLKEKNT